MAAVSILQEEALEIMKLKERTVLLATVWLMELLCNGNDIPDFTTSQMMKLQI